MFKQICHDLILQAMPEIVELHFQDFDHQNIGTEGTHMSIDDRATIYTDLGHNHGQIVLHAGSGLAEFKYQAGTLTYGQGPGRPKFLRADIAFLRTVGDKRVSLGMMLKSVYPSQNVRVTSFTCPAAGLGPDFRFHSITPLGVSAGGSSYWEIEGNDSHGDDITIRVEATSKLHLPGGNNYYPIQSVLNITLPGQPMASGGFLGPSNVVPPMLTPGAPQLQNYNIRSTPKTNLAAAASFYGGSLGVPMPLPPAITAYNVLDLLEQELKEVKTGQLSQVTPMIYRISIGQCQDWRDVVRDNIAALKTIMGDKIAHLSSDFKIIGLDEPPEFAGKPGCGTERATGKVAVHVAYRSNYQHHKITILALVKAP